MEFKVVLFYLNEFMNYIWSTEEGDRDDRKHATESDCGTYYNKTSCQSCLILMNISLFVSALYKLLNI